MVALGHISNRNRGGLGKEERSSASNSGRGDRLGEGAREVVSLALCYLHDGKGTVIGCHEVGSSGNDDGNRRVVARSLPLLSLVSSSSGVHELLLFSSQSLLETESFLLLFASSGKEFGVCDGHAAVATPHEVASSGGDDGARLKVARLPAPPSRSPFFFHFSSPFSSCPSSPTFFLFPLPAHVSSPVHPPAHIPSCCT